MSFLSLMLWFLIAWISIHFLLSTLVRGNRSKLPPGPFALPVFGNLFALGKKPHESFTKLAKIHGPLMTLRLGQLTSVIASSASMAREILHTHDALFSNRMSLASVHALDHHLHSVAWLPIGPAWSDLRKICNMQLFSSSRLDRSQHIRQKKVEELLSYVVKCCKESVAVDLGQAASTTSLNLLSMTFFSKDLLSREISGAQEFKETIRGLMIVAGTPNFADYFPMLKMLDLQRLRSRLAVHFSKLMNIFSEIIKQRLLSKDHSGLDEVDDVLGVLLNTKQEDGKELDHLIILHLLLDLFVAGTDTTSTTFEWAMAELLHNPDKMKKAQAELAEVIGRGNPVEEADIARLPYLQSIVKETFRLHPPLPFLLPRKVDTDIKLDGFTVPKNAQVLINVWAVGRDPDLWENPNSFEPERFLGSNIDVKGRDFELIPFGAGRRSCPGLPLANRMLHVMLGSLIHSFDWKLEHGMKPADMDMDDEFGLSLRKAQSLRAIPVHK